MTGVALAQPSTTPMDAKSNTDTCDGCEETGGR
jgi:hypothetical protein